jgi:hypothetical protein
MYGHRKSGILLLGALVAAVGAVAACSQQHGTAQLAVAMMDAPNPDVQEVWVNVTKVRAHVAGEGWKDISDKPVTVDLLKLKDSAIDLGITTLTAGTVTQIRLLVTEGGNKVMVAGVEHPLVVPSGIESGIKIGGPWELGPCTTTTVTLDFDGAKSVFTHATGASEEWILRPVIRTKKAERAPGPCSGDEGTGPGGAGTSCTAGTECMSGDCNDGTCGLSGPGEPCATGTDCASGTCIAAGTEAGTCDPGDAHGTGTPCTDGTQCWSNSCNDGTCGPGAENTRCGATTDCLDGLVCTGQVCAYPINL